MPARVVGVALAAGVLAFGMAFAAGQLTGDEPGPPAAFGVPAVPLDFEETAAATPAPAPAPAPPPAPAPAPTPAPAPEPAEPPIDFHSSG